MSSGFYLKRESFLRITNAKIRISYLCNTKAPSDRLQLARTGKGQLGAPHQTVFTTKVILTSSMSRFDISSYDPITKNEDTDGLLYSLKLINQVVAKEVASGIPANRILVGGFSQGGVMSLLVGLTGEHKVGGLAILSGWLPLKERFKDVCVGFKV